MNREAIAIDLRYAAGQLERAAGCVLDKPRQYEAALRNAMDGLERVIEAMQPQPTEQEHEHESISGQTE